jgi:hypothetical protein
LDLIAMALAAATDSERQVIAMLYGFDGPPCAPEEAAPQCKMTPLQVRQTAKTVKMRMRHPTRARLMREGLVAADERIWAALTRGTGVLLKAESLPQASTRLPGQLLFAIECLYGSLAAWLDASSRVAAGARYRSQFLEEEVEAVVHKIDTMVDDFVLPAPLEEFAHGIHSDVECVDTAIRLSAACGIYSGYVVRTPVGTRAPRAVRLHRILAGSHSGEVLLARHLVSEYIASFADDVCTVFDAQAAMAMYPHLFLRLGDLGWCGIGPAGKLEPAGHGFGGDEVTFHRWSEERKVSGAAADWEIVRQVLEEHGALRAGQITRFVRMRSNDKIRAASVTVYLMIHDDFMRLAPGIYGLADRRADAAYTAAATKSLLTRGACLQYIFARWAGEPADAYPLWTPAMESNWCEWAQGRAKDLLPSLLAVVDPGTWPAPDSYKDMWLWKKECLEYYRLETPPRCPFAAIPLAQLLVLVKCIRWRGAANWVLVNRVTGDPILTRTAVSAMALLIGVGAVSPALHWQRPHIASQALSRLMPCSPANYTKRVF